MPPETPPVQTCGDEFDHCNTDREVAAFLAGEMQERRRMFALMEDEAKRAPEWSAQQVRNTLQWLRVAMGGPTHAA